MTYHLVVFTACISHMPFDQSSQLRRDAFDDEFKGAYETEDLYCFPPFIEQNTSVTEIDDVVSYSITRNQGFTRDIPDFSFGAVPTELMAFNVLAYSKQKVNSEKVIETKLLINRRPGKVEKFRDRATVPFMNHTTLAAPVQRPDNFGNDVQHFGEVVNIEMLHLDKGATFHDRKCASN